MSRPVSFVFREIFLHSNHGRPLEVTDVFFFLGWFVLNFVLDKSRSDQITLSSFFSTVILSFPTILVRSALTDARSFLLQDFGHSTWCW